MKPLLLVSFLAQTVLSLPQASSGDIWRKRDGPQIPGLSCNGYGDGNKKYISKDVAERNVNKFCDDIKIDENSNKIVRKFNEGSIEEIEIAIDWPSGLKFEPDVQRCKDILLEITNKCNTDNDDWRSGGYKKDGEFAYHWHVTKERSRAHVEKMPRAIGVCSTSSGFFIDDMQLCGSGFLGDDFGERLKSGIRGRGLILDEAYWKFEYGEFKCNGELYEWTASFKLGWLGWQQVAAETRDIAGMHITKCRD
ncbi:hypothetical protein M011DRAFT_462542 [Sporormia fimetaria CBS 119925]|uniref:Ecp2 effector protein domain-containing protein n=1 Tax=Sporormia fimetaria CBS 119925 TaxID=1340428 RepID=A0A6A6UY22_9PLEO|nr:hypothetical protein M011DRAFT_462542 [Sporormia fimetaria CBS 119925]